MSQQSDEPWWSDAKPKVQVVEFLSRDPVLPESGMIEAQPDSPSGHALNVAENGRDIEGKRTMLPNGTPLPNHRQAIEITLSC